MKSSVACVALVSLLAFFSASVSCQNLHFLQRGGYNNVTFECSGTCSTLRANVPYGVCIETPLLPIPNATHVKYVDNNRANITLFFNFDGNCSLTSINQTIPYGICLPGAGGAVILQLVNSASNISSNSCPATSSSSSTASSTGGTSSPTTVSSYTGQNNATPTAATSINSLAAVALVAIITFFLSRQL